MISDSRATLTSTSKRVRNRMSSIASRSVGSDIATLSVFSICAYGIALYFWAISMGISLVTSGLMSTSSRVTLGYSRLRTKNSRRSSSVRISSLMRAEDMAIFSSWVRTNSRAFRAVRHQLFRVAAVTRRFGLSSFPFPDLWTRGRAFIADPYTTPLLLF